MALERFGGHVALDFANTREGALAGPPGPDHLAEPADLLAWSRLAGTLTDDEARRLAGALRAHPRRAAAALDRALALRAAIHAVFDSLATGAEPPPAALDALAVAERDALAHARLVRDADGRFQRRFDPAADTLDRALWPVAAAAVELLRSGELHRLKRCGQCVGLFLDRSRNASRRWCTMEGCGSQVKMRRYRAGRRAG